MTPIAPPEPPVTGGGAPPPSPDPQFRPDPVPGAWGLELDSDEGDHLGQGRTWRHGSAYGETIDVDVFAAGDIIQFATRTSDPDVNWVAGWATGDGSPLRVGTYVTPADGSESPTQSYAGEYRACGRYTGAFTITALSCAANGALRTLRVEFEAHCEGLAEAVRGRFAFDAAP